MQTKNVCDEIMDCMLLESNKNIAIFPHNFPDGDTLGSAIGILELLRVYQKKGVIVLNDSIPSNLMFLFEGIDPPLSVEAAQKASWDLIICVDCGETKLFIDRLEIFNQSPKTIAIDHHKTHVPYADLLYLDEACSSTGEMVANLYLKNGVSFSQVAAKALYAAIVTDTGSFRYSNTAPSTFNVCGELLKSGFDFNHVNVQLFQNKELEKIRLLNEVFNTLSLSFDNRLALVVLSKEMIEKLALSEYDTDGIVEFVRDIKGIEVVVFIRYIGNGEHKISMRSKYDIDVSAIANHFDGGGHTKAAGFKSTLSLDEIIEQLNSVYKEAYFNG